MKALSLVPNNNNSDCVVVDLSNWLLSSFLFIFPCSSSGKKRVKWKLSKGRSKNSSMYCLLKTNWNTSLWCCAAVISVKEFAPLWGKSIENEIRCPLLGPPNIIQTCSIYRHLQRWMFVWSSKKRDKNGQSSFSLEALQWAWHWIKTK